MEPKLVDALTQGFKRERIKREQGILLKEMSGKTPIEDILVDLFESVQQAQDDFCGEQRDWHLPRLRRAAMGLMAWFPADAGAALARVKTPYDSQGE